MAALSADEAAVYDRQIRVWGVEAQQRLRRARVLVVGLGALAGETAKNAVLAGVGALTVCPGCPAEADPPAGAGAGLADATVLLAAPGPAASRVDRAAASLRLLNPRVEVRAEPRGLAALLEVEPAFFQAFDAVCLLAGPHALRLRAAALARARPGGPSCVFVGDAEGATALVLADLGPAHAYSRAVPSSVPGGEAGREEASLAFPPAADVLALPWARVLACFGRRLRHAAAVYFGYAALRELRARDAQGAAGAPVDAAAFAALRKELLAREGLDEAAWPAETAERVAAGAGLDFSPCAAVVGGLLAQEVIKTVSGKDRPLRNVLVYDCLEGAAVERYVGAS